MALQLLKIVTSLFVAVWAGIVIWQFLNRHDDDDWPQGGAAA